MPVNKYFLLRALLQYNYFPGQKKANEVLPPILNTENFKFDTFKKILALPKRVGGYDSVEYKLTRHTNVSRLSSIPHPKAYSHLCDSIFSNWTTIQPKILNKNSLIYPKQHKDKRIIIMDYDDPHKSIRRILKLSLGKKFCVSTDITNFYPSIYSHSIPWALVGIKTAKRDRDSSKWFNQIDASQRLLNRNETNGVPIGPATSNIISEIILANVDEKIRNDGFTFYRFIDDYTAYCETYEKAEEFIRRLSEELSIYKLSLNIRKTSIYPLPTLTSSDWITDLVTRHPGNDHFTTTNAIRFLDYAVSKQAANPDGSVIKYAVKMIFNNVDKIPNLTGWNVTLLFEYVLVLCIKYPILIPVLDILFDKVSQYGTRFASQLINILDEHATNRRSDAMTWTLYYINKLSISIPQEIVEKIIQSKDCVAILFLYLSNQCDSDVIGFCNSLDKNDLYLLDQYWLLLYQLFFDGKINHPYQNVAAYKNHTRRKNDTQSNAMNREVQVFTLLKSEGISFIS